jgi:predicted P-loop ATPase
MGTRVGGVRISTKIIQKKKIEIVPENEELWNRAITAYQKSKSFDVIEKHAIITNENKQIIKELCDE